MKVKHRESIIDWAVLIFIGCIWGSSFILMKIGARAYTTMGVSSLRMFFAGMTMIPFFFSIYRKFDKKTIFWMFVSAMLGSAIPSIFYAYSASKMDSNINGIINSLTPVFTMIVGMVWLKYKVSRWSIAGVMVGFLGIILLFLQRKTIFEQSQYAIFPLIATMMYGVNMNIVKVKLSHLDSIDILKGVFGILGILYIPLVIYLGVFSNIHFSSFSFEFWKSSPIADVQTMNSLTAMFLNGVVGSLMASLIFYFLLKRTNALFASMNTYIIPLMSIFWGYIDGESISWMHFVSLFIIMSGVYLVSKKK